MARVTVEDCVQVVPNRYELVLMAAQRARDVASGSPITLDRDNDKNPVVALREIANQTINLEEVRKHIVHGVNRMSDENAEDADLKAIANMGIEGEPNSPTAAAIEDVLFDGIGGVTEEVGEVAGDDFGGDEGDFGTADGAVDGGMEDFGGAEDVNQ